MTDPATPLEEVRRLAASAPPACSTRRPRVFEVQDAGADARFADNPLVTGRSQHPVYAGCPIAGGDGSRLGTLCVIDHQPRQLTEDDIEALRDLAEMVEVEVANSQLALTDELSALANRRGLSVFGATVLGICARQSMAATLVYPTSTGSRK